MVEHLGRTKPWLPVAATVAEHKLQSQIGLVDRMWLKMGYGLDGVKKQLASGDQSVITDDVKKMWTYQHAGDLADCRDPKELKEFLDVRSKKGDKFTRTWKLGQMTTDEVKKAAVHDVILYHYQNSDELEAIEAVRQLYNFPEIKLSLRSDETAAQRMYKQWKAYFESRGRLPPLPAPPPAPETDKMIAQKRELLSAVQDKSGIYVLQGDERQEGMVELMQLHHSKLRAGYDGAEKAMKEDISKFYQTSGADATNVMYLLWTMYLDDPKGAPPPSVEFITSPRR